MRRVRGLSLAVSHTSRPPRPGEKNGVHYHFVSREEFLRMVREGAFVEWVRLHGRHYGTSRGEIERLTALGRDILLDIDVRGAARVVKAFPEAVSVFVLPPSFTVLEERLRRRGSEGEEQIRLRLEAARRELRAARRYRYCIVNNRLAAAVARLQAVITAERLHLSPASLRDLLDGILSR